MATIVYNAENIADAYAPSLNAAFVDLYNASGIRPRVIAPYGAWSSAAIDAAYGIKGRGSGSDHYKGRAVDIYNWSDIANRITLTRMKAILAARGWRNIQVNGDAFPTEPWHYANHSSTPAGSGGTPIDPGAGVDPEEAARAKRRKKAKGMSYLCIPTTDWKTRPLMADGKTPHCIVWEGATASLVDTIEKLTAAQRMHPTDEDRKVIDANDFAWMLSLRPTVGTVDIDEAALAAALGPMLVSDADLAAAVQVIKSFIPTTFTATTA